MGQSRRRGVRHYWNAEPRNGHSWALIATRDHNINPDPERKMAKQAGSETIEVAASHAADASRPKDVARLIEQAAKGLWILTLCSHRRVSGSCGLLRDA